MSKVVMSQAQFHTAISGLCKAADELMLCPREDGMLSCHTAETLGNILDVMLRLLHNGNLAEGTALSAKVGKILQRAVTVLIHVKASEFDASDQRDWRAWLKQRHARWEAAMQASVPSCH